MPGHSVTVRRDSGIYGYERALRRAGLDPVAGADEAGRGACAGPLVAAAVILSDAKSRQIADLNDSKLLTALQRERLYGEITRKAVAWSGGLEGRPGGGLRGCGLDHRQGDPGPDDV